MATASPWGINTAPPYAFGYAATGGNMVRPDDSYQTLNGTPVKRIDLVRYMEEGGVATLYTITAPLDRATVYSSDRKTATLHGAGVMTWNDAQGHPQQQSVTVEAKLEKTSGNAGYISFKVTEADGTVFWDSQGHYLGKQWVVQIK